MERQLTTINSLRNIVNEREIRLSKRAMRKLDSLLVYLEEEWSTKVKHEFVLKLDKSLKQIQKLPDSFTESEKIKV